MMAALESKPYSRLEYSLTHGNIWLSALSVMRRGRAYAYALPEKIHRRFGFAPSKLMTYFVLYKLEDEGLVKSNLEGRRKYYSLTKKGRRVLADARRLLSSMATRL